MSRIKRIEGKLDRLIDTTFSTQEHLIRINEEQKELIKFVKNHSIKIEQIENRLTNVEMKVNWIMTQDVKPKIQEEEIDEINFEKETIEN